MCASVLLALLLTAAISLQGGYSMSAALYYDGNADDGTPVTPETLTCQADFGALLEKIETLSQGCGKQINFSNCCQLRFLGIQKSGVYLVRGRPTYCDMETGNGGWLVIQRRRNAKRNFYRKWYAYTVGFGSVDQDFWYGLENIHQLTASSNGTQLRVDLQYPNGTWIYAKYKSFRVGSSEEKYPLWVDGHSGSASDSLQYHNQMKFSTYDSDNDKFVGNCAKSDRGAWWYNSCYDSNLNGHYDPLRGVLWRQNSILTEFTKVEIKIRPRTWYCNI